MRYLNPKTTICTFLFGLLMLPNQLRADVNVLIIGCSKDSGEMHPANVWWSAHKQPHVSNSKPFSPTAVRTQSQNILAQDGRGTVNVTVLDRYRTNAIAQMSGWYAHSYNLTNRKLNEAPMARNLPARSLWAQIHKEYPALSSMRAKAKGKGEFAI